MSSRAHSTRRLTALYVTALSTVALLSVLGQSLVQYSLHKQSADSRVINMAGRQRMLSQRIAKSALALTNVEEAEQRSRRRDELRIARDEWEQSHMGLRYGDADLGLAPNNSSRILALFADIQHPFEEMSRAVDAILAAPGANASAQIVADILLHEELFLAGMDAIVSQYENESRKRVERLRAIEMVLLATTLSTLLCEGLFVFRPAVRRLRQEFERVQAAEARDPSIASELTTILDPTRPCRSCV